MLYIGIVVIKHTFSLASRSTTLLPFHVSFFFVQLYNITPGFGRIHILLSTSLMDFKFALVTVENSVFFEVAFNVERIYFVDLVRASAQRFVFA